MSYRIDVSFKNCEKNEVYDKIKEFTELVKQNATQIISNNIWLVGISNLKQIYEKNNNAWDVKDKIREWLTKLFSFHIYYAENIKSLCFVFSNNIDVFNQWFDGYVYFQNSCDQDYGYSEWRFNDKFKQYIEDVEFTDKDQLSKLYKEVTGYEINDDEDCEIDYNYIKRKLVYSMCYKEIEPIWNSPIKIQIKSDMFDEYIDYTLIVIRMLCGLEPSKLKDEKLFEYFKKVFKN